MPVHAVRSAGGKIIGWQFGQSGKIYKTKAEAEEQERAIRAIGWSGDDSDNNEECCHRNSKRKRLYTIQIINGR